MSWFTHQLRNWRVVEDTIHILAGCILVYLHAIVASMPPERAGVRAHHMHALDHALGQSWLMRSCPCPGGVQAAHCHTAWALNSGPCRGEPGCNDSCSHVPAKFQTLKVFVMGGDVHLGRVRVSVRVSVRHEVQHGGLWPCAMESLGVKVSIAQGLGSRQRAGSGLTVGRRLCRGRARPCATDSVGVRVSADAPGAPSKVREGGRKSR